MTRITCTCCGDEMEVYLDEGIAECGSCGSTQMLPKENDEERISLLNQADELRRKCSFDAAIAMYSSIISKFPDEAVAYFRLALSEYGIEYVKDINGKYIPTFHRMSYDNVLENRNIKLAIEKAGPIDMLEYQQQAQELERVRQGILEKVSHAKSYDVFISFKQHTGTDGSTFTFDYDFGNRLYQDLTEEGYQVFFSPVTLQYVAGEEYEPAIFTALNSAKVMILLSSNRDYTDSRDGENSQAVWVENEWTRFLEIERKDRSKKLIPCFYGTPSTLPDKLASRQGVDMSRGSAAEKLLNQVARILPRQKAQPVQQPVQASGGNGGGYGINEDTLLARVRQMLLDREFDEAKSKCEQILDANSSCAEAYMSRALITRKENSLLTTKESLVDAVLSSHSKQYTVAVSDDDVRQLVKDYEVPNYLTASDIEHELPDAQHYVSRYDAMVECREDVVGAFFHDKDVARAYSNATGAYEKTLQEFKEEVYDEVDQIIDREKTKQETDRAAALATIQNGQQKATEQLKTLSQEAVQQREADYQQACTVHAENDVPQARKLLRKVGDYKDAPARKKDLDLIADTLEQVGDGSEYLCWRLAQEQPDKLKEYVESSLLTRNKFEGKKLEWYWLLVLVLCFVIALASLFSGIGNQLLALGGASSYNGSSNWLGALVLIIAFAVPIYLYLQGKTKLVKTAFTVLFIVANILMMSMWSWCAAICAAICLRKKGVLNFIISKLIAKRDLKLKRDKEFVDFEQATRQSLESEWQRVLGHSFTMPLASINDTLSAAEKGDIVQWYNRLTGKNTKTSKQTQQRAVTRQNGAQLNSTRNGTTTSTSAELWVTGLPGNTPIQVIAVLRRHTGWGLAESKQFVDNVMAGNPQGFQINSIEEAQALALELQQAGAAVMLQSTTQSSTIG